MDSFFIAQLALSETKDSKDIPTWLSDVSIILLKALRMKRLVVPKQNKVKRLNRRNNRRKIKRIRRLNKREMKRKGIRKLKKIKRKRRKRKMYLIKSVISTCLKELVKLRTPLIDIELEDVEIG